VSLNGLVDAVAAAATAPRVVRTAHVGPDHGAAILYDTTTLFNVLLKPAQEANVAPQLAECGSIAWHLCSSLLRLTRAH